MNAPRTLLACILAGSLVLFTGACALMGPRVETKIYETADGAIVVESLRLEATVKAIDERARTVTIDPKYGDVRTVKVSPDMVNFSQIRVGDEVHVELIEELAVSLLAGGAPESVGRADLVALAPVGEKPAIAVASSREVTADVIAIDAHAHRVTLEFIDGSTQSVKVGKHIDLSKISLDDSVRIVITDAVMISVESKHS